jgi:transcriptional regulator with XRE-family HTH domain
MLDKALRTVREVHQIPQVILAEKLGISKSHLSELESGKKAVSVDLLKRYADIFDVPPSTFLSFMEALEGVSERRREKAKKLLRVLEWTLDKDDADQTK